MTRIPTTQELALAIREVTRRWIAEGRAASTYDIDDGQCEDLAQEVAEILGGEREGFEGTWAANLSVGGEGDEWDVALLRDLFPGSVPTHGLSWEDVLAEVPAHYWLVLHGRHHDAECPEGTDNLFELPLLRRRMEALAEARAGTPGP